MAEGIFPGGRIHEFGSGFRGSGSYLDLLRPVIAIHTVIVVFNTYLVLHPAAVIVLRFVL